MEERNFGRAHQILDQALDEAQEAQDLHEHDDLRDPDLQRDLAHLRHKLRLPG